MKIKKVGTLTLGVMLIVFGLLFLTKIFFISLSYEIVLKLWPIVFILLGLEILVANHKLELDELKYDKTAFALIFILSIFAMAMAVAELCLNYASMYIL